MIFLFQRRTHLKAKVEAEIKLESERLLRLALAIPIEELKARGTDSVPIPTEANTYHVRKGFK